VAVAKEPGLRPAATPFQNRPDNLPWIYAPVTVHVDNGELVDGIARLEGKLDQVIARDSLPAGNDIRAVNPPVEQAQPAAPVEPLVVPAPASSVREEPLGPSRRSVNRSAGGRMIHMSGQDSAPPDSAPKTAEPKAEPVTPDANSSADPSAAEAESLRTDITIEAVQDFAESVETSALQSSPGAYEVAEPLFPPGPASPETLEEETRTAAPLFDVPVLTEPEAVPVEQGGDSGEALPWDPAPANETLPSRPPAQSQTLNEAVDVGWDLDALAEDAPAVVLTSATVEGPAEFEEPPAVPPALDEELVFIETTNAGHDGVSPAVALTEPVRRTTIPEDFPGMEISPRSMIPSVHSRSAVTMSDDQTRPVVHMAMDEATAPDLEVTDSKVVPTAWQEPEIVELELMAGAEPAAATVAELVVAEPLVNRSAPRTPVPPVPAAPSRSSSPSRASMNAVRAVSSTSALPPASWTGELATSHSVAAASRSIHPAQQPARPQKQPEQSPSMLSRTSAWWPGVTASPKRQSMAPLRQAQKSRSATEAEAREARHATGKHSHSSHAAADARRAATAPPKVASPLERATGDSQAGILLHRVSSTVRFAAGPKSLQ
jgi:hypothetical protein